MKVTKCYQLSYFITNPYIKTCVKNNNCTKNRIIDLQIDSNVIDRHVQSKLEI